jgi:hypothetical protein
MSLALLPDLRSMPGVRDNSGTMVFSEIGKGNYLSLLPKIIKGNTGISKSQRVRNAGSSLTNRRFEQGDRFPGQSSSKGASTRR